VAREDVARHNTIDKVLGWALPHERVSDVGGVLLVSVWASFKLVQKA
jgi:FdhD protein